jgi:hypothetical protein
LAYEARRNRKLGVTAHDFYSLETIIQVTKLRTVIWLGYVAAMVRGGEEKYIQDFCGKT